MINPLAAYRRWVYDYVNRLYLLSGYDFNRDFTVAVVMYAPMIIVTLIAAFVLAPISVVRSLLLLAVIVLLVDYLSVLIYANAKVYVRSSHFERYLSNTLMVMIPLIASGLTLEELISTLPILRETHT
ncbi:hypothetical protein [Vulcanisaeta distributa]|uniref:hypothetical protein n=1 Tax=Vulcanisaeta distributa TaxID=164451 RepID=UPI0006D0148C|nr:hypothetical protein [Vulcanisaeta distributa]